MRYFALATDYDGTLAHDGVVDSATIQALEQLRQSGRKIVLVTGRELPHLQAIFSRLDLFERVVVENGALLYNPWTKEQRELVKAPPPEFIQALKDRGVTNFSVGKGIVATWRPHEVEVLEAIQELGLELHIVFNKEAVMVLPSGINKSTGLCAALEEIGLSPHNVVGIGDAENDHAFLERCECGVAVANSIPSLKERATFVTKGVRGDGVRELIDNLLANDLRDTEAPRDHSQILIGSQDDRKIGLSVYGRTVLVCGHSGSGKSTLVTGLIERLTSLQYQTIIVDPEGDYGNLPNFRTIGSEKHAPSIRDIEEAMQSPATDVLVNLLAIGKSDRADRFNSLVSNLQASRLKTGRPHWIVIDEAHHVFPAEWNLTAELNDLVNVILITVHPEFVSPDVLKRVNTLIVVGDRPEIFIESFSNARNLPAPACLNKLDRGEALVWFVDREEPLAVVRVEPSRTEHERHKRKYAEGKLEDEFIFHFRGPGNKMDLRAHNLSIFIQMAEGIDDETWGFHLNKGDYSHWILTALKDSQLAEEIAAVERNRLLPIKETRAQVIDAIQRKYTAPAN